MLNDLHSVIGAFVATLKSPKTAKSYQGALLRFEQLAPPELERVDETLLIAFSDTLSDKAAATRELYLSAVVSFFAYLIYTRQSETVSLDRARLILKKLRGRTATRFSNYPMQDLQTFLNYAQSLTASILELRDRALIVCMAKSGLRVSEAASLKLRDLDLEQGQAVVSGKGDKQAVVYFGSATAVIKDYLDARRDKAPHMPLFTKCDTHQGNQHNNPEHLTAGGIWKMVEKRAVEALGHKRGIHPHALRHYFVTTIWRSTHDLVLAKELARHENVQTTMRYTHVSDDALKAAHMSVFK